MMAKVRPRRQAPGTEQTNSARAPQLPPEDREALRQEAEEQVQRTAEALRRFALPMSSEPAFVFKP